MVHLNHYEHSRPYRKGQLELVLTREEREVLLAEWGVSTHDIVSSTRALIKAKNQRRQTVRNLNKAERVEESLENATRKLKRLFSLRKSTRVEVDKLQRQAEIAAALSPARFQESQESVGSDESGNGRRRASPSIPRPEIIEQDDGVLGPFDVKLGPLAGNGKISQHKVILNDDMDAISCISGFTLGNSTTASALEIERFHRELELELFGDQELPSMLGQTLEVNVDIPEEDKVFHDPSPICGTREPPSVVNESCYGESTLPSHYDCYNVNHECPPIHHSSPMHQLEQLHMPIQTSYENQCSDAYGNYQMQIGGHPQNYNFRLGGSLGSSIEANRQIQNGVEHQQQQSPFSLSQASTNYSTGSRWTDATPYSNRRDQNQFADGPMVSYMPLASHLSPNNWMEGSSNQLHGTTLQNPWDAVIISEDDLDEIQQHFMEQGPGMPYYL